MILFKFGLEAGKAAFAGAAQSAKSVQGVRRPYDVVSGLRISLSDIVQDDETIIKYASRAARLLKQVAERGFDPDPSIVTLSVWHSIV